MPVFPAVASMTVPPGFSLPSRSARSIKPMAARSFTLPPGFKYSSLAKISADPGGASFFSCSIGVSPTSLEISSLTRRREFEVASGTLQSKERQPPASIATGLAGAPGSLHCGGGIGALPTDVGRRPVRRRHRLSQQTQVDRQLRPVMSGMQDAPPEDPDSFPAGIKERDNRPPPVLISFRHESKSRRGKLQHPLVEVLDRKPLRQDLFRCDFRHAEEFGKESPLRKQLVLHDVGDRTGTRMRAVAKIGIEKGRPDGNDFIRLAGVGIEDVLEERNPGAWNLFVTNRRKRIFHKCNVTLAYCPPEAGSVPA